MTLEPLPKAAEAEYLTEVLRRAGVLRDGRVCASTIESSRPTILSRIIRLRLSYDGATIAAPATVILKTGLPERASAKFDSGRTEVVFYREIAAVGPPGLVSLIPALAAIGILGYGRIGHRSYGVGKDRGEIVARPPGERLRRAECS
jgi:hypothetical protein